MIFGIFELPENFLMGLQSKNFEMICKVIFYAVAIGISLSHQQLGHKLGLRKTLYGGLICNILGISALLLSRSIGGWPPLVVLNMIFFGAALTSVINSLVTYIILEFPDKVGFGIVALFAFLNIGQMLSSILLEIFQGLHLEAVLYPFLIFLLLLSIWFVHKYFFDPFFPPHMEHARKGTLIWKELHYRLALFVIAIVAYGLTETTFSLWGYTHIEKFQGLVTANELIPFFWLFMIIGQMILLLPLYFFPQVRIFYSLIIIIIGAAFYFPLQSNVPGLLLGLIAAGAGCSAVFPILLSMLEKELFSLVRDQRILPYIEVTTSLMIAGYFVGVGTIDLWVLQSADNPSLIMPTYFHLGAVFIAITGLIALFLNLTTPKIKT
jgi:MFS family permease